MRKKWVFTGLLVALLVVGCGEKSKVARDLQSKGDELTRRVQTLEDDLHAAKRQLIAQEQAIATLTERLRTMEQNVDKLAYQSSIVRK
jgi:outer membrane murein-binding lipoprotein Lpp